MIGLWSGKYPPGPQYLIPFPSLNVELKLKVSIFIHMVGYGPPNKGIVGEFNLLLVQFCNQMSALNFPYKNIFNKQLNFKLVSNLDNLNIYNLIEYYLQLYTLNIIYTDLGSSINISNR
jgi:hypothetical protein